ncbi:Hsp70 family protein [Prosthecomicrobium pneumaticum]|uniref:Putative chaperone protein n=1 Tax=Prosthecomicrobium pneumaticum TaxID=81895 RepID=A0A7W9FN21_9HYPH|nr:Hsp70 family protein [Prosthecomicrobium pneumaticum]MBB5753618.1 putative chaperone protein [Prosthecomicrobium pneumaticum]
MTACGLDFGTSNTTLGVAGPDGARLVPLEDGALTLPSALFFHRDGGVAIGRAAVRAYVEGADGRLMRSIKSALGNSLIEETTQVGRERIPFRAVIGRFIGAVKRRAEEELGRPFDRVVHGRPVHFVDGDPEGDRRAEAVLAEIGREAGFAEIVFQYEPIAAALDYETQIDREELALIADIGGGTSDFSIVRIGPARIGRADRSDDILANDGVRIGGTDFDRQLNLAAAMPLFGYGSAMKRAGLPVPSAYFHDLATWSTINRLYETKRVREIREVRREAAEPERIDRLIRLVDERGGHRLAIGVEEAKIALSDMPDTAIGLDWVEPGLAARLDRPGLVEGTATLAERIAARVGHCLTLAGLAAERIDAVFLTGGSTKLAHVRAAILAALPKAKAVEGDTFGSVGLGLTLDAARRFGPDAARPSSRRA